MYVTLCGNNTEEPEEYITNSGYDKSELYLGWGYKYEDEPECKSDAEI